MKEPNHLALEKPKSDALRRRASLPFQKSYRCRRQWKKTVWIRHMSVLLPLCSVHCPLHDPCLQQRKMMHHWSKLKIGRDNESLCKHTKAHTSQTSCLLTRFTVLMCVSLFHPRTGHTDTKECPDQTYVKACLNYNTEINIVMHYFS